MSRIESTTLTDVESNDPEKNTLKQRLVCLSQDWNLLNLDKEHKLELVQIHDMW